DSIRTKLRLGQMRPSAAVPHAIPPFRDIARMSTSGFNDAVSFGATEVLLADARNDDNANLSQLTTVFLLLHNAVVDKLVARDIEAQGEEAANTPEVAEARYWTARHLVSKVYWSVVRNDLLKRLLHPEIFDFYNKDWPKPPSFIDNAPDHRVPLEFSHAAF